MKKEYDIIVDYVEGKLSAEEFRKILFENKDIQKILKTPLDKDRLYLKPFNYNLYDYFTQHKLFDSNNWNNVCIQFTLQSELIVLLKKYHISYNKYEKYKEDFDFLLDIQPSWLDIGDSSILKPIIDSIPADMPKTKRIAMGKAKIKEMFRYDKTYPRWVQEPEWPIVNGKPLVFSHQQKVKGDDFHFYYFFYNPDTKEETVVEQFG